METLVSPSLHVKIKNVEGVVKSHFSSNFSYVDPYEHFALFSLSLCILLSIA